MMDPGVGNERTALAWQRTALALVAGSAILTRLTFDRLGAVALMVQKDQLQEPRRARGLPD